MRVQPPETDIKAWYNRLYKAKGLRSMRPYETYPMFLDYLEVKKGKKLLDVGCGTGYLLLAASQKGLETFGVDISEEAVNIAVNVSPKSIIVAGKGEDLKFSDNTFDYVTCLGSLEHFLDMDKALQEMRRVANEHALFCIMVPNSDFIFWKISGKPGTSQQDINENLLSLKQWKRIFLKNGFRIFQIHQDKWPIQEVKVFSSLSPIGITKRVAQKLIWVFLPLNFAYQFIFVLKKAKQPF